MMRKIFLMGWGMLVLALGGMGRTALAEQDLIMNKELKSAQTKALVTSSNPSSGAVSDRLVSSTYDKNYKLEMGDRIQVVVYPEDEYIKGGMTIVGQDGRIFIDGAGKVEVAGKTIHEAEEEVTRLLEEYFVSPDAVIDLLDSQQRSVVVLGQVKKPGTYYFPTGKTKLTLLESISLAGGFSEVANVKNLRIARKNESGVSTRIEANAENILNGKEPDVQLQAGDIVSVGESVF
ncbi:MAG: polysaccharide biosynthesis/export family protein [Candidatus Omnitrophota bacterium]